MDVKTVSEMLGHYSAGFTLDTYAHVTTAAQKEAADTMQNVLAVDKPTEEQMEEEEREESNIITLAL